MNCSKMKANRKAWQSFVENVTTAIPETRKCPKTIKSGGMIQKHSLPTARWLSSVSDSEQQYRQLSISSLAAEEPRRKRLINYEDYSRGLFPSSSQSSVESNSSSTAATKTTATNPNTATQQTNGCTTGIRDEFPPLSKQHQDNCEPLLSEPIPPIDHGYSRDGDDDPYNDRNLLPASVLSSNFTQPAASLPSPPTTTFPDRTREIPLPPPLPEPKYSVRRRVMPSNLVPLNSKLGRQWLVEALTQGTAASYITLTEHFCNQSDPAFCGVTTLQMTLNALAVDPNVRWKGGWRYFGSEDVLLQNCCIDAERVRRIGITLEEFLWLASCQGLNVTMKRAGGEPHDEHTFRKDIQHLLYEPVKSVQEKPTYAIDNKNGILVVSFSRKTLGQTGDGHFSPLAAYHADTDQVLVLDVARFKYQPYWVKVADLYQSMMPVDQATKLPRGWYLVYPPKTSASYKGLQITTEELRPAEVVPALGQASLCPVNVIKVTFCKANQQKRSSGKDEGIL